MTSRARRTYRRRRPIFFCRVNYLRRFFARTVVGVVRAAGRRWPREVCRRVGRVSGVPQRGTRLFFFLLGRAREHLARV